ncbi:MULTISPECIES: tetratricopeptide repeat protein [unclassified Kitasatospora]|uniref:tetratricopeptide repeat protein n=1 Tax=unclassified Kitasatospora TaxID=2633591 RepID=UPI0012F8BD80|nr:MULTISPECIES: tetratricopeptide repeat protein [unclassified Kitasatospora]
MASGERSISINTEGAPFLGNAFTGDNATVVQIPPGELRPPATVEAPPGLVNLPVRHATFVGRAGELQLLDAVLDGAGAVVVQALHGLGGVGKSALAARWAGTRVSRNNPVWWITADTPTDLDAGLAALAAALQPALAQLPQEQLTERALQWLATHTGWLLVLDNVDDPYHVAPLLGRVTTGRILITSRRSSGWHDTAISVPLDVLSPNEAVDLLTQILTRDSSPPPADPEGAAELCRELGELPLAIEQAGAYIAEAGITARAYLGLLADHPADMYREAGEGHDVERTIAQIWRITLDRLTDTPLASQILRILAWYAPDNIPRSLFGPLDTRPAVHRAIRRLAAYSMITANSDTLTVHRLVQALARTPDTTDPHRQPDDTIQALHDAAALVHTAIPTTDWVNPATWPAWRRLLPHVETLESRAHHTTDTRTTAELLFGTGVFLRDQGQAQRAIQYLQRAHNDFDRLLGADDSDTLTAQDNLAWAYRVAGDLDRAIPLFEQTRDDRVRELGEKHRDTLATCNNLAEAYQEAGDLKRAIPLLEQTLANSVVEQGEDDPATLTTRNNLARAYRAAGDLHRAIPLFEQTLTDQIRNVGGKHPQTIVSRNNLGHAYRVAGDLKRAISLYKRASRDAVREMSPYHPIAITLRNNLARAYEMAGARERANRLHKQTLNDAMLALGPNHPTTKLVAAPLNTSQGTPGLNEPT